MIIPCVYMRGGTSKAVFFHEKDLPEDKSLWPKLFMKVMGTPDPKQIDGMGGAYQITSKIAVVSPSNSSDYDVNYTFFQVGVDKAIVADNLNCGNISCAVGPFAVDEGLVKVTEPETVVRVYNTNTKKFIEEHVPVKNGRALTTGNASITGVPGTGAGMDIYFEYPGGAATGKLFPSGHVKDLLCPPGYEPIEATLIDCSNPVTIIRAKDLGLDGGEIKPFQSDAELLTHIEAIRCQAAVLYGFVDKAEDATEISLAAPKIAVVSEAHDFIGSDGQVVQGADMDICSRVISVGAFHKTHPITSGIALAAAAVTPGTIVSEMLKKSNWISDTTIQMNSTGKDSMNSAVDKSGNPASDILTLNVGHPYGILPIKIAVENGQIRKAGTIRTARRIMDGYVYID